MEADRFSAFRHSSFARFFGARFLTAFATQFTSVAAILMEMVCAVMIFYLAFTRQFDPVIVLIILTVFGVARAFLTPASSSLVVNVVPKEDFANAIGWITSSWQLASIFGPVAGGLLYGISGPAAYGFAALTPLLRRSQAAFVISGNRRLFWAQFRLTYLPFYLVGLSLLCLSMQKIF